MGHLRWVEQLLDNQWLEDNLATFASAARAQAHLQVEMLIKMYYGVDIAKARKTQSRT
jgi:hypothetical protein